jgi:hypothetical protein
MKPDWKFFKLGMVAGISLSTWWTIPMYFESDQHVTPEEFSFYDGSCLKAASTTKSISIDIDDAVLKCHNGATFEFDRKQFEGGK